MNDYSQAGAAQPDTIHAQFLAQDEQRAENVARMLAAFIAGARRSLDFAIYDFRLSAPLKAIVANARRRVLICSMLLNASALILALGDLLRRGQAQVSGVYDRTRL